MCKKVTTTVYISLTECKNRQRLLRVKNILKKKKTKTKTQMALKGFILHKINQYLSWSLMSCNLLKRKLDIKLSKSS